MTRRATFARKAVVAAWRLRLGHALAPAGMRGEQLNSWQVEYRLRQKSKQPGARTHKIKMCKMPRRLCCCLKFASWSSVYLLGWNLFLVRVLQLYLLIGTFLSTHMYILQNMKYFNNYVKPRQVMLPWLNSFSSPSHIPLFCLLTGLFPSTNRYIICYGI